MKSLLATALLLLAMPSGRAFAPPSKSRPSVSSKLQLSPHHMSDFSLLISDAADIVADATSTTVDAVTSSSDQPAASAVVEEAASKSFSPTYSNASYYTTLALYVASFPGLWSQIKRSTKAKVKRKTYVR